MYPVSGTRPLLIQTHESDLEPIQRAVRFIWLEQPTAHGAATRHRTTDCARAHARTSETDRRDRVTDKLTDTTQPRVSQSQNVRGGFGSLHSWIHLRGVDGWIVPRWILSQALHPWIRVALRAGPKPNRRSHYDAIYHCREGLVLPSSGCRTGGQWTLWLRSSSRSAQIRSHGKPFSMRRKPIP